MITHPGCEREWMMKRIGERSRAALLLPTFAATLNVVMLTQLLLISSPGSACLALRYSNGLISIYICSLLPFSSGSNMPGAWCLPIAMQSGCCKPPDDCKFTYVPPTYWNKEKGNFTNADCRLWDNRPAILCYDCASCKAGLLDRINRQWKIDANLNAVVLLVLVIVFIVGCSSLSENRTKVHAYRTNRCPYPSSSKSWLSNRFFRSYLC